MRNYRNYLLGFWAILLTALAVCWLNSVATPKAERYSMERITAKKLLLTDLCLSTESRHTRHISMPEWIAPFQDLGGYHDHFPSSSFFQYPHMKYLEQDGK